MNPDPDSYIPATSPEFLDVVMRSAISSATMTMLMAEMGEPVKPMIVLVWDGGELTPCIASEEEITGDQMAALYADIVTRGNYLGDGTDLKDRKLMGAIIHSPMTILTDDGIEEALVTAALECGHTRQDAVLCGMRLPLPADFLDGNVDMIPAAGNPVGYELLVIGLEEGNAAFAQWQAGLA